MATLRFTSRQWASLVEGVTSTEGAVMEGPTSIRRAGGEECILVRSLRRAGVAGASLAEGHDDLLVFGVPAIERDTPCRLLAQLASAPEQRVTVMAIGVGPAAGRLAAVHTHRGSVSEVDRIEVVGAGRTSFELRGTAGTSADLANNPGERWSRTVGALQASVWQLARKTAVTLLGCGRSGSLIAHQLALLGVERLSLVDADVIEEGNLDAMLGVTPLDVGEAKVEAVASALCRIRPDLELRSSCREAQENASLELIRNAELIVTAVDRDVARLAAAIVASANLVLHLDVGTGVFGHGRERRMGADIRLLIPGDACVSCAGGGLRDDDLARYELIAPPGALRRGRRVSFSEQRAGSLITVNSVACGLALQLWLDLLAARIAGSTWLRIEWGPDGTPRVDRLPVEPRRPCEICADVGLGDRRFGA